MLVENLHEFSLSPRDAVAVQRSLANRVSTHNLIHAPRLILGLDVSVGYNSDAVAAAVVLKFPGFQIIEKAVVEDKVSFPYIPGLLSFREIPISLKACEKLTAKADMAIIDGQGMAHPRRIGLASHLGLFLNIPAIGCAKSRLCGEYEEPPQEAGKYSYLLDNGETIGAVLRTRVKCKPLFVSIGHQVDLTAAIDWVLKCCQDYRLPEPTRLAHLASRGKL